MRDNFLQTYLMAVVAVLAVLLAGGLPTAARLHERSVGIVGVVAGGLLVGLLFLGAFVLTGSVICGYICDPALLKAAGWWLVVLGVLIAVFSRSIVFPGLEWLLGIEKDCWQRKRQLSARWQLLLHKSRRHGALDCFGGWPWNTPGSVRRCLHSLRAAEDSKDSRVKDYKCMLVSQRP